MKPGLILFLGAVLGGAIVGGMPQARAQLDTNSVAACYADGTYRHETWANVGDLADNKDVVTIAILHDQIAGPGSSPNIVELTGHDRYALRALPSGGLLARSADVAPGPEDSREHVFRSDGTQQLARGLGNNGTGNGIGGGMHVFLFSKNYQDADYTTMQARCTAMFNTFRAESVPASGTY